MRVLWLLVLGGVCWSLPVLGAKPNILFCLADDASYPHMGAYGTRWVKTPAFDRVAREGLLFNRCYTPVAKCTPSRSSIITGRYPWMLKDGANLSSFFPLEYPSVAEVLGTNGYYVGYTAKGWGPGNQQGRLLMGTKYSSITTNPPTTGMNAIDYAANFWKFLTNKPADKPFCFFYTATEPHRPYQYGTGVTKGGKRTSDIDRVPSYWPDNGSVRNDMLDYAYEIDYFDYHVQQMLSMLESRGLLTNTVVMVTADNGMPFPRSKGHDYEISNHVPLAIMWPAGIRNPGRIIDDLVSFIDFAPTFLELAGIPTNTPWMAPIWGSSLMDIFTNSLGGQVNPLRTHTLLGRERNDLGRPHDWGYPIRAIVKTNYLCLRNYEPFRWPGGNPETGYTDSDSGPTKTACIQTRTNLALHYIWELNFGKRPAAELYDLSNDTDCLTNLAALPSHAALCAALVAEMESELVAMGDPRMFGQGHLFEEYPYSVTAQQNYYDQFFRRTNRNAGFTINMANDLETDFYSSIPPIIAFTAQHAYVVTNQPAVLDWRISDAAEVVLDHGIGQVTDRGPVTIVPSASVQHYWISAINPLGTNRAEVVVQATVDSDGDGLPDAWELAQFGTLTYDAASDPDQDRMSTAAEYAANTNPNQASSALRMSAPALVCAGQTAQLVWEGRPGLIYRIEASTNLVNWRVQGRTDRVLCSGPLAFEAPVSGASGAVFWRVGVEP